MTEIIKKLINLLGEEKVKFSQEYFEKYGIDWYKEIETGNFRWQNRLRRWGNCSK